MRGRGVGRVIRSRHENYREGDIVVGSLGWQDYSVQHERGTDFVFSTWKLPDRYGRCPPHSACWGRRASRVISVCGRSAG